MYGVLTPEQSDVLGIHVAGKHVIDLGAGDLKLAQMVLRLGADRVTAIDKENYGVKPRFLNLHVIHCYFDQWQGEDPEVALVSWPQNKYELGLLRIVERSSIIVYRGCNTGGSACGWPDLFAHFLGRDLLAYVPHPRNTLIVYGAHLDEPRKPRGEERAGLNVDGLLSFEASEKP